MTSPSPQPRLLFENFQWLVTTLGIDTQSSVRRPYYIPKGDLLLLDFNPEFYRWPLILVQYNWVDYNAFVEGYRAAIVHHRPDVDKNKLVRTVIEGGRRYANDAPRRSRLGIIPRTPKTRVAGGRIATVSDIANLVQGAQSKIVTETDSNTSNAATGTSPEELT